jgi:hypothetical protein
MNKDYAQHKALEAAVKFWCWLASGAHRMSVTMRHAWMAMLIWRCGIDIPD